MAAAVGKFRKGAEASAEASKGGGQFAKTHYLSIEDGKSEILRFLTDKDDWIVVNQHQMVKTKPKPQGFEGNWPDRMGAVCRADEAFEGMFSDCFICEFLVDGKTLKKPGGRTWALACLREQVLGDGSPDMGGPELKGKVVGVRDQVREIAKVDKEGKPTGETTLEKAIVIVNQGYKNFFSALSGFAGHYGTVLDRDYLVKRSGDDTSTTYQIIPLDPIEVDDKGTKYDLRNPEFLAAYGDVADLGELVTERASDEFYARFFDTRYSVDKEGKVVASGQAATPEKPSGDVTPDRMTALASRVTDYAQPKGGDETAPAGEEPVAAGAGAAPKAGGMRNFG